MKLLYHGSSTEIKYPPRPHGRLITLEEVKTFNSRRGAGNKLRYYDGMRTQDVSAGRNTTDFGRGFYLSEDKEFASLWAGTRRGNFWTGSGAPVLYTFELLEEKK